jgi:hypothetical protein
VESGLAPLGEIFAVVRDGVIAQPGVGDSANVTSNVTLPVNFMYALTDISVDIDVAGLIGDNNWALRGTAIWFDTVGVTPSSAKLEFSVGLSSPGAIAQQSGTRAGVSFFPIGPLPNFLQVGGGLWNFTFENLTTNDIAANFNFVARFLRYTVAQQFDAGVNTPSLTR